MNPNTTNSPGAAPSGSPCGTLPGSAPGTAGSTNPTSNQGSNPAKPRRGADYDEFGFNDFKVAKFFGFDQLGRQLFRNFTDESRSLGISRKSYAVSTCVIADWNRQRPAVCVKLYVLG